MKRLITFVILAVLLSTAGFAARQKDLSGPIAIKGELQQQYENFPAGTPVVIRKVVKMKSADQAGPDIFYATEINGIQFAVPASALKTIKLSPPETNQEFWQQTYLNNICMSISANADITLSCARKWTKNVGTTCTSWKRSAMRMISSLRMYRISLRN